MRAVVGSVDGEWSATSTGRPVDHGDTRFTATAIGLNASVVGTIGSASDDDYFRMTLAEASGVFIYTTSYITGFLQTTGDLRNSGGTVIKNDDQDTAFRQHGSQLFLWDTLDAGTYYVRVGASETGAYTLHSQTVKDATGTADAADLALNGFASGILDPTADDEDYFRIELSQAADLMIRVTRANGGIDTEGALLDAEGEEITVHDDSFLGGDLNRHFLIRKKLEAGVYYLRVRSDPLDGGYEICRGIYPSVLRWGLGPLPHGRGAKGHREGIRAVHGERRRGDGPGRQHRVGPPADARRGRPGRRQDRPGRRRGLFQHNGRRTDARTRACGERRGGDGRRAAGHERAGGSRPICPSGTLSPAGWASCSAAAWPRGRATSR